MSDIFSCPAIPTEAVARPSRSEQRRHWKTWGSWAGRIEESAHLDLQWSLDEPHPSGPDLRRIRYASEDALQAALARFDQSTGGGSLTIVLILDPVMESERLLSLIQRQHPALWLIVMTPEGGLRGDVSAADLSLQAGSLGWHTIQCQPTSDAAVAEITRCLLPEDTCIILLPL